MEKCIYCKKEYDPFSPGERTGGTCNSCVRLLNRNSMPEGYLKTIGVKKRHLNCSFENYHGEEKKVLIEIIDKGIKENVLIQSVNTGNGKTHLAVSMLRKFGLINSEHHYFINFSELMLRIKDTFGDRNNESEFDIIEKYCKYKMLVVDDVGAEKTSEYAVSVLYIILNNRYENIRPTIITTNMTSEEIVSSYGRRILSRMRSGHLITLKTKDQRGI